MSHSQQQRLQSPRAQPIPTPTPKITSTHTTIAKSSRFIINRHHLDDSQMKKVLNYMSNEEEGVAQFEGQVIKTVRREKKQQQHPKKQEKLIGHTSSHQYYGTEGGNRGGQRSKQNNNKVRDSKRKESSSKNSKLSHSSLDFQLNRMQSITHKLQKQAIKFRQLYRNTINNEQRNRLQAKKNDLDSLRMQVQKLKVQNVVGQLKNCKTYLQKQITNRSTTGRIIQKKQKRPKRQYGEEYFEKVFKLKPRFMCSQQQQTDSQFSSFQI